MKKGLIWLQLSLCTVISSISFTYLHVEGLAKDCSNSSALAMELLQSCAKPSILPEKFKDTDLLKQKLFSRYWYVYFPILHLLLFNTDVLKLGRLIIPWIFLYKEWYIHYHRGTNWYPFRQWIFTHSSTMEIFCCTAVLVSQIATKLFTCTKTAVLTLSKILWQSLSCNWDGSEMTFVEFRLLMKNRL